MITALAGGVGAAKLLEGLVRLMSEEDLTIIVNTGDDIELFGLYISPDVDIIMYTLAGIIHERGWGVRGDTFHCLEMLKRYGSEGWFQLGDYDLATHILRSQLLKEGLKLSEVTGKLCRMLGLKMKILPMTDERVETKIVTDRGTMHFQEYLVKRGALDKVLNVFFYGMENAKPAPKVIDSILEADGIIVCPSNPIVSIGTILSVKGVRDALRETRAKIVAISPIVGGSTVKGPADKLMGSLGIEVSAYGVAGLYQDFLDDFVIDDVDEDLRDRIEDLGINVHVTDTIMRSLNDKVRLAKIVLDLIRR